MASGNNSDGNAAGRDLTHLLRGDINTPIPSELYDIVSGFHSRMRASHHQPPFQLVQWEGLDDFQMPKEKLPKLEGNVDQAVSYEGDNDQFGKLFKCPVCYNTMLPPILVCVAGHSVCNSCRANVTKCPTCRGMFSGGRNWIAEGLIDLCVVQCKYTINGCTMAMKGAAMGKHQETCEFKK